MKRKSLSIIMPLAVVMLAGCITAWQAERKVKYRSEPVDVRYDYSWEKVYDAYRYVLLNSAMPPIVLRTTIVSSQVKFFIKEKKIVVLFHDLYSPYSDVEWAISFTPDAETRTKVSIAKGATVLREYCDDQDEAVKALLNEVNFVLKNNGRGYYDYTTANALKYDEQYRAKKANRRYDRNESVR
jgi:hypothetical protein